MKHKQKVKLARKLRTQIDIEEHTPIFNTKKWQERKERIRQRVYREETRAYIKKHNHDDEKIKRENNLSISN